MSGEVKQRKKGGSPTSKEAKDTQRSGTAAGQRANDDNPGKLVAASSVSASRSMCPDVRTLLCCLCLALCATLTWMVFQQSQNFTLLEQKYQSLQSRSSALEDLEAKVGDIFGKLEERTQAAEKLKDLQLQQRLEQVQNDVANMKRWTETISGNRGQLEGNLTNLELVVSQIEQSTAAIAKDVSGKLSTVKTDVRRVSGMEDDVVLLTNSATELEKKLEKVEKNTAQSIGDALAHSIDRITSLKDSVATNSNRIDLIKLRLTELRANFSNNSDKLSSLESDRLKVLQAVNFANEMKPKVFTLKKDFARLEALLNELSLRIGRLAADLMNREKDINVLSDKMYNLTVIKSEILALNNKISSLQAIG
ncbi:PREDICTED: inhibitor of nuclear factor kappa-B kinase-interacting protein isoform X2 [Nanorana parkeri]|uniref:inhibitor of nuclear factor kappa-B kinase-interacting protein isoform X2 n=1 Tax=Nanorana parkeri TaxID=125878 RepID=UPI000854F61F|nr:PREDICTED: inhibitor of nuclear factor kappa-B kinase-interacting protein isoform X2 [Nanorana parkeri]